MNAGCRALTPIEESTVLSHLHTARDRALFVLGMKTGFRIAELRSLTWKDVMNADGTMKDIVTVPKRHMKGKKQGRGVVLHPNAAQALKEYYDTSNPSLSTPVFASRKHNPDGSPRAISTVEAWRILRAAYDRSGLSGQLGTHSIR